MDRNSPFAGNVALITGASRGIGLAIAERLGQLGARLAICARDSRELDSARSRLASAGFDVFAMPCDVSSAAQTAALAEKTAAHFGPIDFLINNAGTARFGPLHESTEQDWDAVLDTNLKGVFLMSRAVIPAMISRRRGHIVNISSLAGKNAFAGGGLYCASKWGLLGLTYCMAEDLRGYGIRVSAVCPGTVATGFGHPSGSPSKKDAAKMLQPADVAHAVEMTLSAAPHAFISEVLLRPTQKP